MNSELINIEQIRILTDLTIEYTGCQPDQIIRLKGDASKRAIYRITCGSDTLIGIYGPDRAENNAFIGFSETFRKLQLPVPKIYAIHKNRLAYLMEDLGDVTLFSKLSELRSVDPNNFPSPEFDKLYHDAIDQLVQFQLLGADSIDYSLCYQYKEFAEESWNFDHNYFLNYFVNVLSPNFRHLRLVEKELAHHIELLEEIPRHHFLYRDFQTRNIMVTKHGLKFIDYQSGRRGALSYDIASLLFSTRTNLPADYREKLLQYHIKLMYPSTKREPDKLRNDFAPYSLIRVLQALGAYGNHGLIQGKPEFLAGIPFGLRNVLYILESEDSLKKLSTLLSMLQLINYDKSWDKF